MKKLCYSAFIAFWSSIATLVALHVLAADKEGDTQAATDTETVYTLEQVAAHDTQDDCWMAIEGKVYNITPYFAQHPTPPSVLTPWCGKEATEGMRTKGYGSNHSPVAWGHLPQLQVGVLAGAP